MARRSNSKTLSDEERDARRKADRDRIEGAARALLTSDAGSAGSVCEPATASPGTASQTRC
jgi:hypothetical protein